MQTHAPNGCGPLGHRLLRALNDELAKGQVDFNDPGSMSDFIEEHQGVWMSSMPADQDAAMRAERASLLENWSDKPIAAPKKEVSIHAAGGPHPVARDAAANAANADAANAADAASAKASAGHEAPVTHQEISLQSQLAALQAKLAVNTAAMDAVDKRMDENDALRDKLEESRDKLQVARAKFGKLQSRSDRIEANVKVVAAKRATMVTQFAIFQGGVRDWVARLTGKRS